MPHYRTLKRRRFRRRSETNGRADHYPLGLRPLDLLVVLSYRQRPTRCGISASQGVARRSRRPREARREDCLAKLLLLVNPHERGGAAAAAHF